MTRVLLDQVMSEEPRAPRRLNDRIPRDLETICLKCLAKEPRNRYTTAGALATDLRRWLEGKPILARPVGRACRLWFWARRNPALAVTTSVAVVALAAIAGKPAALLFLALVAVSACSLIFALYTTKKGTELASALSDARQDQLKAASALQFALQHCFQAREERDRALAKASQAQRRFGSARRLAKALLFDLPDLIARRGSRARARWFVIQTALAYLDSLKKDACDDSLLLREVALAYARVGDLQVDPASPCPDDPAGALANYRKSVDLLAALARNHPDNAQAQRDLVAGQEKVRQLERGLGPTIRPRAATG
jgi:hypothetical protein